MAGVFPQEKLFVFFFFSSGEDGSKAGVSRERYGLPFNYNPCDYPPVRMREKRYGNKENLQDVF